MLLLSAILAVGACSSAQSDGNAAAPADNVATLLAGNEPRACAVPEAINTALAAANNDYHAFIAEGGDSIRVDTISAAEIKKDIHEITCKAVAHYRTLFTGDRVLNQPFEYKLRPSLDDTSTFIVEVPDVREIAGGISLHIAWWRIGKNAAAKPPQEDTEEYTEQSSSTNTSESKEHPAASSGGECSARVLRQVSALEDRESTMPVGETYSSVTQFWRNTKTGDTWFCAHGDYCYPSHVVKDGQRVEAIRLTNCRIGNEVSRDGDEVMYAVE